MATSTGSTLPHRAVANIKSPTGGGSGSPSTPPRGILSSFGSPSSLRAEEDLILIDFGSRKLQVGFAGDAVPRGSIWFGPDQQRRVGDFRIWQADYKNDWKKRASGRQWGRDYELWRPDVRELDLGLVADKVERAVRDAYTQYMLIDSRPRRMVCVLPSGLPLPLLSATLDALFSRFLPPTISLLSSPVAVAVGAGVRSALVVDLGWAETVVTSIYEYREVHTCRTVRAGRMLTEETHKLLASHLGQSQQNPDSDPEYILSFEECNEIASRLVWCKPSQRSSQIKPEDGLATVEEQDESETKSQQTPGENAKTTVPLRSYSPRTSLDLSYEELAKPCENTFFDSQYHMSSFDDHELPVHLLIYRSLRQLPLDVRAICMSRIIFTGGGANVLGLRRRIFDEVSHLIEQRGWDSVQGKAVDALQANPLLKKRATRQASNGPTGVESRPSVGEEHDGVWYDAVPNLPEVDPVEEQLKRGRDKTPQVQGVMRAVETVGAWSGASLITQVKAPAIATIDRDIWQQQGVAGASKPSDVDPKNQRQSLGAGGLIRGAAGASWTLGIWGAS
ncbi:hypothetical protein QBC47DRAFT_397220 [Echria macrotheca]|uniref:Actin-like ATPase domain-containing protein n=1 Tax=Echria macrotheca TaxID=438768 RepID=A0AAJ0FBM0_9PEZI|nr:hypothetical protein QBC47DRAFT_397220 [Echria macrotheca]